MTPSTAPVALVTGANKGIGLGLVKQLAQAGWTVYLGSRDAARDSLPYSASKSALNAFTVLLSKELYAEGFAVNAVNPGYTATDLNGHSGTFTVEQAAATVARVAMSELGTGSFFTEGGHLPW